MASAALLAPAAALLFSVASAFSFVSNEPVAEAPLADDAPLLAPALAGTLAVVGKLDHCITLIDLETQEVRALLRVEPGHHELAVSPNGRLAVAARFGAGGESGSTLTVVDIVEGQIATTIELGSPRGPFGVVWLEGSRVLVTSEATESIIEVDIATGETVREMPTRAPFSHQLAVTPDRSRAFTTNVGAGTVSAIDLRTGEVLAQLETGAGCEGICISRDGREVWVANRNADRVLVFDAETFAKLGEIECPEHPYRVAALADGVHALVTGMASNDVAIIDMAQRKVVRRIPNRSVTLLHDGQLTPNPRLLGPLPGCVLEHPDGRHVFIASLNSREIGVLDTRTWTFTGVLFTGGGPGGMGWSALRCEREDV